jgi:hypothetical protein
MAEWWEGRGSSSEFRAWFYSPYRSIVEQSFRPSREGKLKRYVEVENDSGEGSHDDTTSMKIAIGVSCAVAASILAFVLGRRSSSGGGGGY